MTDFYFFLKTFILTIAIVLVMQIEVGRRSLESHAIGWVQSSAVVQPLRSVSRGAAKVINDTFSYVTIKIQGKAQKKKKEEN